MIKFKEKKTGRVWTVSNAEHIKHFRFNPRFEEIKEEKENKKQKVVKPKKEETTEE